MGRIIGKLAIATIAFAAGITWAIIAEANDAGVPLTSLIGI